MDRTRRAISTDSDPPEGQRTPQPSCPASLLLIPLFLEKSALQVGESARARRGDAAFVTNRLRVKVLDSPVAVHLEGGAELVGPQSAL